LLKLKYDEQHDEQLEFLFKSKLYSQLAHVAQLAQGI